MDTTSRITRRNFFRGQHVTVTFTDGWASPLTGTIDGWGSQIIAIRPDVRTAEFTWKVESFPVQKIDRVVAA